MGKLVVLSVLVVVLAAFVGERLIAFRNITLAFRELTKKHLPNCQLIEGIDFGSEDVFILEEGLAFISTGLKYPGMPYNPDAIGKILLLDLHSGVHPVELNIKEDFDTSSFNPHGISVYTDERDGSIYLFVVNHPHGSSQVDIFKFVEEENALLHLKTIKHELLHHVNDIVAVGLESFYATNDHFLNTELLQNLEVLLQFTWCDVVYYSPEGVKSVMGGFSSANGINISPDKRYLYVSDIMNHSISVLEIQKDHTLSRVKEVAMGSLCDNIEVDAETGDLWVGCHPNAFKFFLNDPNDLPGSEVFRIQNIHSEEPLVTQVFSDDGSMLIGSSVAARYGGKLLIGTVYHKALYCDLS
ncbi:serum paraoxonase/arylesterase 2-like [Hoplias malabaricus]|uniref:serum paraoxonase/arylesterase 2-like n=1 Tax=Hoplias malabaricus TaxID=27720 RepID=UPI003462F646